MGCGPALAWDWFILDLSYILLLIGGAVVLRARGSSLTIWIFFGLLSVAVGGFLFSGTFFVQTAAAEVASETSSVAMLSGCTGA